MLGTLVLLGLALPHQCSHWVYPYNLERSLFKLVFQLPAGLGCSGQCGQIGRVRTMLPQLQGKDSAPSAPAAALERVV